MILIDFNATAVSNFAKYHAEGHIHSDSALLKTGTQHNQPINKDEMTDTQIIRHMLLKAFLYYRREFSNEFGEIVLCCDSSECWRKEVFPLYKAKRNAVRAKSALDWKTFGTILVELKEEFKKNLPYKVIEIEGAEADDVIAVLCENNEDKEEPEKILIYSGDHDFLQLQKYINVKQWDQVRKRYIVAEKPDLFLNEKIIRGDSGDGIPNILSPDDSFVMGKKQKSIMAAKANVWITQEPEEFCDEDMLSRWNRNKTLIDFQCIPNEIKNKIISEFDQPVLGQRRNLLNYIINIQAQSLFASVNDF